MRRIAATLLMACATAAYAATPVLAGVLEEGSQYFQQKNYEEALKCFNKAARENPDSVPAHFWRAQSLEALNRREESVKEFQLVLLMNPSPAIKQACEKELDYMTLRRTKAMQMPTITPYDVERAATSITDQAAERIRLLQRDHFMSSRTPPRIRIVPGRFSRARYDYSRMRDFYSRSIALRECADGLRQEMSTKPSDYTDVYLSPQGTNLYVRNYVSIDPVKRAEPIEPQIAKTLSFDDIKPTKKK